ncbi:tyrosine-type recombinase/integrase [Enorma massiliensis]|uniref:Site-specific integrase n=1 Tax=Enorma massiliensis TaxID=1472761 RepID=A0A1Y3U2S9_9ACTN|nr:tyrosine-type recombinase/integrase [Enorma massiliensis]OUN41377.1 hypothetical protein B5G21_09905 [Enorma massiliensis]
MSYGEGSIREKTRPDGKSYNPKRWQICVSYTVEVVQEDGTTTTERKRIQKTVRGTKTHAKEVLEQIKAEHDDQGREIDEFQQAINATEVAKPKATTLTDMIETWNTARKTAGKASERTIREDRKRLERIEAYLGDKPIGSITAQMVEQTYAAIRKKHGLSGTTMNHLHTLLKNVFQKAVDYDLIPKNPCHFVTAPKREERGHARDRNALRGIHRVSNIIAVRIGLATGMRRGEVIGLVWKNVDLTRGTIRVCQAATIAGKIKTPKTQAGIRTLAIDTVTAQHLSYWKARQAAELAKIGIVANGETPVCSSDVGTMIRVDNFEHWWAEWRKEHDFVGLKYHELRHTQATMLLSNGVDIKTVQTRLGHSNPTITLSWYAHAIPENDHDAAQMLGNILNQGNATATLPEDPKSSKKSSGKSSTSKPEADDFSMSSKCLPNASSRPK